jgi:hypothetical protein
MFRFSIRDLIWFTAVIALACGLVVTRSALASCQKQLTVQMNRAEQLEGDLAKSREANIEMFERLQQMMRVKAIEDALNSIPPARSRSN